MGMTPTLSPGMTVRRSSAPRNLVLELARVREDLLEPLTVLGADGGERGPHVGVLQDALHHEHFLAARAIVPDRRREQDVHDLLDTVALLAHRSPVTAHRRLMHVDVRASRHRT